MDWDAPEELGRHRDNDTGRSEMNQGHAEHHGLCQEYFGLISSFKSMYLKTTTNMHEQVEALSRILEGLPLGPDESVVCTVEDAPTRLANGAEHPVMLVKDPDRLEPFSNRTPEEFRQCLDEDPRRFTAMTDHAKHKKNGAIGRKTHVDDVIKRLKGRSSGCEQTLKAAVKKFGNVERFEEPIALMKLGKIDNAYHAPAYLVHPRTKGRFNFIDQLTKREPLSKGSARDVHECQFWTIFTQEDAIHLPHQDRHGLWTWVTVVFGSKLWIYWPDMDDNDRKHFCEKGQKYPESHKARWVILKPGDTLIMRSGTPHCVYSLEDSLMYGGHFWDFLEIRKIIEAIKMEIDAKWRITNEDWACQLPCMMQNLKAWVDERRRKEAEEPGTVPLFPDVDDRVYANLDAVIQGLRKEKAKLAKQ